MNRLFITLPAMLGLAACFTPEPAQQISTKAGKAVYQTQCEVNQSPIGRKAVIGKNRGKIVTPYYACEPQARATCANGFDVHDMQQGRAERKVAYVQNGPYRSRQTYYVRQTTIQYSCKS
jgi:hypothetical protein